jgi:dipeptidyl aminopeptidase/acylaminoacyl peptidase
MTSVEARSQAQQIVASTADLADGLVEAWGSWGPTLSPDCRWLGFVSDRSGAPRLWIQELSTAPPPARMIELSEDPVVAVNWSADGGWLACSLATDGGVRTQVWVVRPDGSQARRIAGSADRHAELGPWTRSGHRVVVNLPGEQADQPSVCYLADPATAELTELAVGELISVLDLSVDEELLIVKDGQRGRQFCVVVDRINDHDYPLLPYPGTGSTDRAMIRPGPPGETGLVGYVATDAGLPRRQLVAVPLGPAGWSGKSGVIAHRDDAELEGLDGDDAGATLLLVWNAGGSSELELLDTRTDHRRTVPALPGLVVTGALLSRDGTTAVLSVEGPRRPRELWALDIATLAWSRATDVPPLPAAELVVPTLETFRARDGLTLTGWLYRVPGRVGAGPAMLSLHGGPEAQERPTFNPQHQAMVAAGITVFAPNIRGSSGYGRVFVHADDIHGRRDAFDDVLDCRTFLVASGIADPRRIAVTGRSYGGYLTLATLAFSPGLFAAGVDICGMSDLHTFYRDTEPWIAAAAYSKYGHPEHDWMLLRALSPMHHAERIDVPLLVVHGELDTNVPLGEALQIVDLLSRLGRPVEYLQLDGEGHEYRRAESRRLLIRRMLGFLEPLLR